MSATPSIADRLPETFAFSQSSLQAYADCPRRFWLAYVEQLPWPAVEASPVQEYEARMRQGGLFHRLIERAEIGMDLAHITPGLDDPLDDWFAKYQRFRPADLPTDVVEIEKVFSIPFGAPSTIDNQPSTIDNSRFRLAAKYDLIAVEPGRRAIIIDWKTSRRRGDEGSLSRRLQSVVYPYVLVEASKALSWGPLAPHQVEMRYWFTAAPSRPVVLPYSAEQHVANGERLHALLTQILHGVTERDFSKVADTPANRKRFCAYCIYRSRCDRGAAAGDLDELDDVETFFAIDPAEALEFTLEDVAEIEF
jgi:hypothetical protein